MKFSNYNHKRYPWQIISYDHNTLLYFKGIEYPKEKYPIVLAVYASVYIDVPIQVTLVKWFFSFA